MNKTLGNVVLALLITGLLMPLGTVFASHNDERNKRSHERTDAYWARYVARATNAYQKEQDDLYRRLERERARIERQLKNDRESLCERLTQLKKRHDLDVNLPPFCSVIVTPIAPTVILTAIPTSVTQGASSTLTWVTTNAIQCTASDGWSGAKATTSTQSVVPTATTTYTLACSGAGGTTTKSVTVGVATTSAPVTPLPTVDLIVASTTLTQGASTTLSWTSTNAASCITSAGWTGARATTGVESIKPLATTTYTLACGNVTGTTTDSVTVNVVIPGPIALPLPTVNLTADPLSVTVGGTSTLSWNTTNAAYCVASGAGDWLGAKTTTSGTSIVTASTTTTYSLACGNATGTSTKNVEVAAVPVVVPPPTGKVLISEVLFDPGPTATQGSDTNNEWVEIHNGTNAAIDLNGWTMHDTILGTATDTFATTSLPLPAGAFLVVTRSTTTDTFWTYPVGTVVIHLNEPLGSNGLTNTGEAVVLRNASGVLVDGVSWGTDTSVLNPSVPVVPEGTSIARTSLSTDTDTNADWASSTPPTPGS